MNKVHGFSLIELVVFIAVIGLAVASLFAAFSTYLTNTPSSQNQIIVQQLAASRMEIILGKRRLLGYVGLTDPCVSSPPAMCTTPTLTGYNVTSSIATTTINTDNNYSTITVTATGPNQSRMDLKCLVANY